MIENMRLNATIRISVKNNETGECHKIELVRLPFPSRKFLLRFDGKFSNKVQEASFTQICEKMRQLLIIIAKQKILHEKTLNCLVLSMINRG